jgi:hypothetical protein
MACLRTRHQASHRRRTARPRSRRAARLLRSLADTLTAAGSFKTLQARTASRAFHAAARRIWPGSAVTGPADWHAIGRGRQRRQCAKPGSHHNNEALWENSRSARCGAGFPETRAITGRNHCDRADFSATGHLGATPVGSIRLLSVSTPFTYGDGRGRLDAQCLRQKRRFAAVSLADCRGDGSRSAGAGYSAGPALVPASRP